jgi:membrane protease YdiL (CAAX protease family)
VRSAQRIGPLLRRPGPGTTRERMVIWSNTLIAQGLLLLIAWLAGRSFGYRFFAPVARGRDVIAAAAALAACFALREVARRMLSEEERRRLAVYRLAPRSAVEWAAWSLVAILAAVAEEIAYRGVGVAVIGYSTGSLSLAIVVCAAAFAVAHALQGVKSAVVIFAFALVMHALVLVTGTLLLAMGVHLVYDVIAAASIAREARRFDRDAETGAVSGRT